ncbi:MAG: hypothetical protein MK207_03085 [Saprospiraceae bacterium]|nr:hypothetical protein [Saprospiraceae bacterium]
MNKLLFIVIALLLFIFQCQGQHHAIGAKGGLLIGTQKNKRALFSYHTDIFFEGMGKWQGENLQRRIGYLIQFGYHRRGASYNSGMFNINNSTNYIASDIFHNFSLALLLKGNFKLGVFLPYYGAGIRLDITPPNNGTIQFAEVINPLDAQGVQGATLGLWLGGGIEWEPPKSPFGMFLELNISPDLTPQIFFAAGTQVAYPNFQNPNNIQIQQMTQDYRIINLSIEVSFGFKFLFRKNKNPNQNL